MFNHIVCVLANSVYDQAQALLASSNKKGVAKYVSVLPFQSVVNTLSRYLCMTISSTQLHTCVLS